MKTVIIFDWAFEAKSRLAALGFQHKQEFNLDENGIKDLIFTLFHGGLNVMLYHGDADSVILFVDTRRFQQR